METASLPRRTEGETHTFHSLTASPSLSPPPSLLLPSLTPPPPPQAYLSQYHGGCSVRDFVVTVAHEGHEGEGFWQWFELQVMRHNSANLGPYNMLPCYIASISFTTQQNAGIDSNSNPVSSSAGNATQGPASYFEPDLTVVCMYM